MTMPQRPAIAVLTPNILTGLGLKAILEKVIPMADVELYADFDSFAEAGPERFYHYFVAAELCPAHAAFFRAQRHKAILLTDGEPGPALEGMHAIDVRTSEERLVHDLLRMHHGAHPHDHGPLPEAPAAPARTAAAPLTDRETEVLTLLARGLINKQIAEELHIGLTTVITHRRNIMEKLRVRSLAELILRAGAAGYVDAGRL